jgi:hypothetical protein
MYRPTFLTSVLVGGEWSTSTPRPLYPRGKSPHYSLDRRLSEPQSRSGRHGEVKIVASTGTGTPTPSSSSQSLSSGGGAYFLEEENLCIIFQYMRHFPERRLVKFSWRLIIRLF